MQCQVLLGVIARTSDQIAVSRFARASA